ncbi:MAG: efflux RND transporter periplasmic adaptor subunit [Ruthenibacterium sp.]
MNFAKSGKIGVAVILCMCVLLGGCKKKDATVSADADLANETTPLAQGALENTITTLCTVASANQEDVATSVGAPILEIYAKVGDTVTQGQPLCKLDTTKLKDDLALKQKAVKKAQEDYDIAVGRAQAGVAKAQEDLNLCYQPQQAALNTLNAKRAALADKDATDQVNPKVAAEVTALESAQNALTTAQAAYNAAVAANVDGKADLAPVTNAVNAAQGAVDAAQAAYVNARQIAYTNMYAICLQGVDVNHAAELQPLITAYNNAVETAKTSVLTCNRSIESANNSLADAKRNTTMIDTAKVDLKTLQAQIDKAVVTAPIAGVIVASKAAADATPVASEVLFSISDSADFEVSGLLNEYDATLAKVGMKVHISTDATADAVMDGEIKMLSPTATDASGNFTVTAAITNPPAALRAGMTGKMHIILNGSENCFYVPTDSIGADKDGNAVIYSYTAPEKEGGKGTTTPIKVTTGVVTDYYTEISGEGLSADLPILNTPPAA